MRCPYCGEINADAARFCLRCGRTILARPPSVSMGAAPVSAGRASEERRRPQVPGMPGSSSPVREGGAARQRATAQVATAQVQPAAFISPQVVSAPEPPAPFPPRSLAQLQALLPGALEYAVGAEEVRSGRKKVIEIVYPPCTAWQQMATLYKALCERDDQRCETVVVRGFYDRDGLQLLFNNGQLTFDRYARLGDRLIRRYLIETHRGFEMEAVRVVLTEEAQEQAHA